MTQTASPEKMIESLMQAHPKEVRHNSLDPTRTLPVEGMYRGGIVRAVLAEWCGGNVVADLSVNTLIAKGSEPEDAVTINYCYSGDWGVWTKSVWLNGIFSIDPAWTDLEQDDAPLKEHDIADLNAFLATARVITDAHAAQ